MCTWTWVATLDTEEANKRVAQIETDAKPAGNDCEAKAAEKKLAGAAKTSFVKKCAQDAKAAK